MLMTIFSLLLLFQVKHFLADFPFQTKYMLGKFKDKGWFLPLAAHGGVHALFTLAIALPFVGFGLGLFLAALDFVIHITMDRLKASPNMWGRYKPDQTQFWNALGFDQFIHHLTHYLIIAVIVTSNTAF